MNSYIFVLAVGVDDRPNRWGSISGYYFNLAKALRRLGHKVEFALNPAIRIRSGFKRFGYRVFDDLVTFKTYAEANVFTHAFIWGGRLSADREVTRILRENGVKVLFSELGWFPQAGTLYFDSQGTNAEVSFNRRQYPGLDSRARRVFNKHRRAFYRRKVGLGWFASPPPFGIRPVDLNKPVLVPLQDQSDTNITLASPFKRMAEFVDYLAQTYPDVEFVVRPHPSAPVDDLPRHANVVYQSSAVDVYRTMDEYGLVIGINSTLLLEAAMMNMPVVAVGQGVGTGTGVFHELAADDLPGGFEQIRVDSARAEAYLAFLIGQRQLFKQDLRSPRRVRNSYLGDLLGL